MKRINFTVWNHEYVSRVALRDLIDPMRVSIAQLGNDEPLITDNWSNFPIMFENFNLKTADQCLRVGRPFGLVVTEWFENNHLLGTHDERTSAFLQVVEKASFIWAVIDSDAYRNLGKPYAVVTPAWEPALWKPAVNQTGQRLPENPLYDLCVYGTPTYSRDKLRERLDELGINYAWMNPGTGSVERNMYIAQSRFVLGLPAYGAVGEPSPGRINIALHNDRPVLSVNDLENFWDMRENWRELRDKQVSDYAAGPQYRDIIREALKVMPE